MRTEKKIEKFKKEWGMTFEEICLMLEIGEEECKKFIEKWEFFLPETGKYYPIVSSLYTPDEKAIVAYLSANDKK